ncbi:MAG: hypothetical protein RLZZ241_2017 [Bacteroidota bacterium]|jgi:XTP/dITP diphosphohydrolase
MKINELVFATQNPHKLDEIQLMVPDGIKLQGLQDIGCTESIPEISDSLQGNARNKALYIFENYGLNCFADDTGLEVEALGGRPGVFSARYAGPACDSQANIQKLLGELGSNSNRKAQFRTVIALCLDGNITYFEGKVKGEILLQPQGSGGFGYDSIFKPQALNVSFATCTPAEKNKISHRGIAFRNFAAYLQQRP